MRVAECPGRSTVDTNGDSRTGVAGTMPIERDESFATKNCPQSSALADSIDWTVLICLTLIWSNLPVRYPDSTVSTVLALIDCLCSVTLTLNFPIFPSNGLISTTDA